MKKWLAVFLLLLCALPLARAQLGSYGDVPIEVNADSTQFIGGVAVAEGHVTIQYGEVSIYSDFGQYNPDTHDALVYGNVRIFREGQIFTGERAVYNFETKQLHAADFSGDFTAFKFTSGSLSSLGPNAFLVRDGIFTTSDSSKPDYYIRAHTMRIYPKKRIILSNATLYLGQTPVFWWPYLYQSLEKDNSFLYTPGYNSAWGAFLLSQYTFPIADNWTGRLHLDLRANRGLAVGLDSTFRYGDNNQSWGHFRSYYADDSNPGTNVTGLAREPISSDRYRISLQDRYFITDDIYVNIDIDKLSDGRVLEDFLPHEYRLDPQPDNVISITKWDNDYTATLIARKQLNQFFDTTERLPEFVFDIKQHPFFDSPVFYEGETGVAWLRRNFADGSAFSDYDSARLDSFHQFTFPMVYHGWLSFVPHLGLRGTYYSGTGHFDTEIQETTIETLLPNNTTLKSTSTSTFQQLNSSGGILRGVVNGGFESSFKISREWNDVESKTWGIDGIRHIIQPYTDLSLAYATTGPNNILQFDRYNPSTELPSFDFPQFTGIDSLDTWAIWQIGMRNRIQTKRDDTTFQWLELDTFLDVNMVKPDFPDSALQEGTLSNLYNRLTWEPLPWLGVTVDSQIPLNHQGFTEVNTNINFLVTSDFKLDLSHRYINNNPSFQDSSLIGAGAYYRINENWGVSVEEQYEFADNTLESQTYELHRDLSSWVASVGFVVRDNGARTDYGLLLTFTLKDFPDVSVPLSFDPQSIVGSSK